MVLSGSHRDALERFDEPETLVEIFDHEGLTRPFHVSGASTSGKPSGQCVRSSMSDPRA